MFLFSDPRLLDAVIAAHRRGIEVRVMLNPERRSGEQENGACRNVLSDAGIEVLDSNPTFDLTHEKSMVVDDATAFIQSLNWETRNLTETRDYAVVTSHAHEVAEVIECFDADWKRHEFKPGDSSHLIWCVGNGRQRIGQFIDDAKETLWVQNERYQDPVMIERLVRAKVRGVRVHVLARPPHKLKKEKLAEAAGGLRILDDIGIKVHKLQGLKLHAKIMLADNATGYRRIHQPRPGQLRQPTGAGDRGSGSGCDRPAGQDRAKGLEELTPDRFERRGTACGTTGRGSECCGRPGAQPEKRLSAR